jgi:hypothetical protein
VNTINNPKTRIASAVGAAIAAVTPALMLLGAGTAQAQDPETVSYDGDLLGVGLTVHVSDNTGYGLTCKYTANPEPGQLTTHLLPPYQHDLYLPANGTVSWSVSSSELGTPALATGTRWQVRVQCGVQYITQFEKTF